MCFQHLDEVIQSLAHLLSAVVTDDEGHAQLGVLAQFVELPRMEVGDEVAVMLQRAAHHPVVETFGQVVQREPEEGEAQPGGDGSWNLHDACM